LALIQGYSAGVYSVAVSDDLLFAGDFRGSITVWMVSSGELVKRLVGTHFIFNLFKHILIML
jgi:hypothetical protein